MKYFIFAHLILSIIFGGHVYALENSFEYAPHGWSKPNLYGAKKILDQMIDFDPRVEGEETRKEEFILPLDSGRVIRLSHNGKVFCYIVDSDLLDPWDYQLIDADGSGAFEAKEAAFTDFPLPLWTFIGTPFPYIGGRITTDLTGKANPSVNDLVNALTPNQKNCIDPYTPEQRAALTIARNGIEPPEKCLPTTNEPPRVALDILFDFNQDTLTPQAITTLNTLGKAMTSNNLKGSYFRIEGHTDSIGAYEYNMQLSKKRAIAVQQYLINNFSINSSQITAVGFGESQPLMNIDPEDGRNRRVEIVNLSSGEFITAPESSYQNLKPEPYTPSNQNK